MMLNRQCHHNVGVRCTDWRGIAVGEIDTAIGESNVVNDVLNLARRNLSANRPLHLIAKVGRFFNAHSGGSAHMQLEGAGVNAGKEVPAQPWDQNCQRGKRTREEGDEESAPMMETDFQQATIALTESFEGFLETLLQAHQGIAAGSISSLLLSPQQVLGHGGD